MNEAWTIAVFFKMFSNAKTVLGEVSAAAKDANASVAGHNEAMRDAETAAASGSRGIGRFSNELERSARTATRTRSVLDGLKSTLRAVADTAGYAALATSAVGIRGAGNLQDAFTSIGAQSGRTGGSVAGQWTPTLLSVSDRTGVSMEDTIGVMREVGGVIKDQRDLIAVMSGNGRGGIVDFANVLKKTGAAHGSLEDISKNFITLAHILNAYKGSEITGLEDKVYRAVVGSHMDLGALTTQAGYFGEQFRLASGGRKTAPEDILQLAETGYWGIGKGKWGSGFGQILRTIAHPSKKQLPYLEELGVLDSRGRYSTSTVDAKGEFTPWAMVEEARRRIAAMNPMQAQAVISNALPANAARTMSEVTSPKTAAFMARQEAAQGNMVPLMQLQAEYMGNLNDQTQRLVENFKNLAAQLAAPWIKELTAPIKGLADFFGRTAQWASKHPAQAKIAGGAIGALGLYGGFRALQTMGNFFGGAMDIAKHGVNARLFTGHHLESAAMKGGRWGRFGRVFASREAEAGADFGRTLWDFVSMKNSRSLIGDVGRFGGRMIEKAGFTGLGAGQYIPEMLKSVGARMVSVLRPLTERLASLFRPFSGIIARISPLFERFGFVIGEKLGLRVIPVVGEVLMLIDTIKFLGQHSKDIGKMLTDITFWIVNTGLPALRDAFVSGVKWIADDIVGFFKGLFDGSAFHTFGDFISSMRTEWARLQAEKNLHDHHGADATVHHQVTVHSPAHVENHVTIHINGTHDSKAVADEVITRLNKALGSHRGTRAGTPSIPAAQLGFTPGATL